MQSREGLEQPDRGSVRPEERHAYDRVIGRQTGYGYSKGTPGYDVRPKGQEGGPYFGALLHSPLIADHISELGVVYRTRGAFPGSYRHLDREFIDIVLSQHLGHNMWGHILDGMAVGVRPQATLAILGQSDGDLTEDEARFADYIRSVADGKVRQEGWDFILAQFGPRGAVEYTAFIGHLLMTIRLIQALTFRTAPSDDAAASRVRDVIAGEEELPEPNARIPDLQYVRQTA